MKWYLGGHLGSAVSALVDGQLDPDQTERAWSHVLTCPPCRSLVEREGWVKNQLSGMDGDQPPPSLLGSLYDLDDSTADATARWQGIEAWAVVDEIERQGRGRRRAGIALIGAGSVSAAVFGIASLSGVTLGIGGAPAGAPAASLSGSTSTMNPATAVIAPAVTVHGRLPAGDQGDRTRRGPAVDR